MGNLFEVDGSTGVVRFKQKGTSLFVTETGASDPVSPTPVTGQIFYNTTTSTFKIWNGSSWAGTGASASGISGSVQFSNGSNLSSDSNTFFWDNAAKQLQLGFGVSSGASLSLSTSAVNGQTGGNIVLTTGGSATGGTSTGGSLSLTTGGVSGFPFGPINLTGGSITLSTGNNTAATGATLGGGLTLTTGDTVGGGCIGGSIVFSSGGVGGPLNSGTLTGGGITLSTGTRGSFQNGGSIVLTTGGNVTRTPTSGQTMTGGSITLTTGDASSGANANGGSIILTSGNPVANTDSGGSITLTSFTPVNGGNINLNGVGAARGVLNTKNFMDFTAVVTPPAVSASGHGRIYFDNSNSRFLVSENGAAYVPIGSGGTGAGIENFAVVVGTPSGPYTGSTTVFDLPFSYVVGSGDLLVFSSGLLMGIGAGNDYLETTTTRVTFNSARTTGEIIRFVYSPNGVVFQVGAIAAKSSAYTIVITDHTILANASGGAFAVTLPASSPAMGYEFVIKKTDSSANVVTVTPTSGTIDGAATFLLTTQYQSVTVQSDGTNWWII